MQCSCCGDYKRSRDQIRWWYVCSNPECRLHYCETCVRVRGMEQYIQIKTEKGYRLRSFKTCIYCRESLVEMNEISVH